MKKIIIGFTGQLACGKGTATSYLVEKYSAKQYKFSQILRDVLVRLHLEQSRDFMIKISETLRQTFGEDILSTVIARDAEKESAEIVVVDGIRRLSDINHLMKLPNFILIAMEAKPEIRYARLIKRGENADDTTKTYEQFLADHQRSTEISIAEVVVKATEHLNNDGDLKNLQTQIDAIVKKYSTE
jgi:dephospho-CoA kinase